MRRFIIEQTETDLTSHSGLALVGMAVNRHTDLVQAVTRSIPLRHGIAHADVLKSYIGLLCLGKSDFEAAANVREDEFFSTAMNVGAVPSPETLRQRLDEHAQASCSRSPKRASRSWRIWMFSARHWIRTMCHSMPM